MPRVPLHQPQVSPNSGQISPTAAAAVPRQRQQFGQAIAQAGGELAKVAQEKQDVEDADLVFRAQTTYASDANSVERREMDAQGVDARDAPTRARKDYDEIERKATELLKTPRQQRLFQQYVAKHKLSSLNRISEHENKQLRQSMTESANASMIATIDTVIASGGDPAEVEKARGDITRKLTVLRKLEGWDDKTFDQARAEKLTALHRGVIEGIADSNPDEARAYYNQNKTEVRGAERDDVEDLLRTAGNKKTAQTFADTAMGSGWTLEESLAKARGKYEGETESAVVTEIKSRFSEQKAARDQVQAEASDAAWQALAQTRSLRDVPSQVLTRMDGKDRIALQKEADRVASGEDVKTDWGVYSKLREDALAGKLTMAGIRQNFEHLDPGKRETLIDLVTKTTNLGEVRSLDSQINSTFVESKIDDTDEKKIAEDAIRQEVDVVQKERGRKLTQEERQVVIDRMLMKGEVIGGKWYWPDPNRRFFETQGEDRERFEPTISSEDRDTIIEWFRRNRMPDYSPTDKEIEDRYLKLRGLEGG